MSYSKANQEVNMETGVTGPKNGGPSRLCTIIVVIVILALIGLSIAGIYFMVKYSELSDISQISADNPPASCLEIKNRGNYSSNYYTIQPVNTHEPFMAYCDMETDGGGWTLVATVHESDVDQKCVPDDVWVSNGGNMLGGTRLWENSDYMVSPADTSTSHDYKNLAYSKLKASDVLVRHVPNGAAVSESKSKANLEYHSTNKFLENYGGNLKSMFADHYSLEPVRDEAQVFGPSIIEDMLDSLVEKADAGAILNITRPPPIYQYVYNDSTPDRLADGGNNMFDPYGMLITVDSPNCTSFDLVYGQTYDCPEVSSRKTFPFFALMKITNITTTEKLYLYDVGWFRGNRDDQSFSGSYINLSSGNYTVDYYYQCLYSDTVPSFCNIWFTVLSDKWGSVKFGNPLVYTPDRTATHANAVYGYTMLAREPPSVTDLLMPIESYMRNVLAVLSNFEEIEIQGMLDQLAAQGADLIEIIPEFFQYQYDDVSPSRLTDGGGVFNPYGMEVQLTLRNTNTNLTLDYGKSYTLDDDLVQVASRKSYPFFALARTENLDNVIGFTFTEGRPHDDRHGSISGNAGDLQIGNFKMSYYAGYSRSNTEPSVFNIIFYVTNEQEWNSEQLTITSYSSTTFFPQNISNVTYDFTARTSYSMHTNAIMGYTLFVTEPGSIYNEFPIKEVLLNILEVISRYPNIASTCATPSNNLVVPVQFTKGDADSVNLVTPPTFRRFVSPGRMQFRATGYNGHVYAFCPAIQVNTCQSKFLCVGGVTKSSATTDDCSDFLDWSDSANRNFSSALPDSATERTHSGSFIQSTIMFFYR